MDRTEDPVEPIEIIVGFDQREAVAYHVFCQSVIERSSLPVRFLPLAPNALSFYRDDHGDGSNSFTYSRFLSPYLMNYQGHAIYLDGDMICNADIAELWRLRDPSKAVQVVKHNYLTKSPNKYLGNRNENYPRKNWSSVVIWNCQHAKNRSLRPDFVSKQKGAYLHRFQWLADDEIGELPLEWNWLATEYEPNASAKLVHYTIGTPCFTEYRDSSMAALWHAVRDSANEGLNY